MRWRVRFPSPLAVAGGALLLGATGTLGACGGSPSPYCTAAVDCLYPLDEATGERTNNSALVDDFTWRGDDDPYLRDDNGDYPNRQATVDAMGPGGECWAFGPGDPYYQACERSCVHFLVDDCARPEGAVCGANLTEQSLSCSDVNGFE